MHYFMRKSLHKNQSPSNKNHYYLPDEDQKDNEQNDKLIYQQQKFKQNVQHPHEQILINNYTQNAKIKIDIVFQDNSKNKQLQKQVNKNKTKLYQNDGTKKENNSKMIIIEDKPQSTTPIKYSQYVYGHGYNQQTTNTTAIKPLKKFCYNHQYKVLDEHKRQNSIDNKDKINKRYYNTQINYPVSTTTIRKSAQSNTGQMKINDRLNNTPFPRYINNKPLSMFVQGRMNISDRLKNEQKGRSLYYEPKQKSFYKVSQFSYGYQSNGYKLNANNQSNEYKLKLNNLPQTDKPNQQLKQIQYKQDNKQDIIQSRRQFQVRQQISEDLDRQEYDYGNRDNEIYKQQQGLINKIQSEVQSSQIGEQIQHNIGLNMKDRIKYGGQIQQLIIPNYLNQTNTNYLNIQTQIIVSTKIKNNNNINKNNNNNKYQGQQVQNIKHGKHVEQQQQVNELVRPKQIYNNEQFKIEYDQIDNKQQSYQMNSDNRQQQINDIKYKQIQIKKQIQIQIKKQIQIQIKKQIQIQINKQIKKQKQKQNKQINQQQQQVKQINQQQQVKQVKQINNIQFDIRGIDKQNNNNICNNNIYKQNINKSNNLTNQLSINLNYIQSSNIQYNKQQSISHQQQLKPEQQIIQPQQQFIQPQQSLYQQNNQFNNHYQQKRQLSSQSHNQIDQLSQIQHHQLSPNQSYSPQHSSYSPKHQQQSHQNQQYPSKHQQYQQSHTSYIPQNIKNKQLTIQINQSNHLYQTITKSTNKSHISFIYQSVLSYNITPSPIINKQSHNYLNNHLYQQNNHQHNNQHNQSDLAQISLTLTPQKQISYSKSPKRTYQQLEKYKLLFIKQSKNTSSNQNTHTQSKTKYIDLNKYTQQFHLKKLQLNQSPYKPCHHHQNHCFSPAQPTSFKLQDYSRNNSPSPQLQKSSSKDKNQSIFIRQQKSIENNQCRKPKIVRVNLKDKTAQDLFTKHKNQFLNKLKHKQKQVRKLNFKQSQNLSKSKQKRIQKKLNIKKTQPSSTAYQSTINRPLSPYIQNLSKRLSSPNSHSSICQHYKHYSRRDLRNKFISLIQRNDNSFLKQYYLSQDQLNQIFVDQILAKDINEIYWIHVVKQCGQRKLNNLRLRSKSKYHPHQSKVIRQQQVLSDANRTYAGTNSRIKFLMDKHLQHS